MELAANVLAITGVAAFAGVMTCVGVTLGGYWRSLDSDEFIVWFGENNGYVARSVPVTVAPALLGLAGSISFAWGTSEAWLWGGSALCLLAVLALTAVYFVPTNRALASGQVGTADVPQRLRRWLVIHNARIGLAALSAIIGCLAQSR